MSSPLQVVSGPISAFKAILDEMPKEFAVVVDGVRYGAEHHFYGRKWCYGYINGRHAAKIIKILTISLPDQIRQIHPNIQTVAHCVIVAPFKAPLVSPDFPWNFWFIPSQYFLSLYLYLRIIATGSRILVPPHGYKINTMNLRYIRCRIFREPLPSSALVLMEWNTVSLYH